MIIESNTSLELKVLLSNNAPVYMRYYKRSGKIAVCRKPSCTIEQVEHFFTTDELA